MLVWFFALGVFLGSACGGLVCPAQPAVKATNNGTLMFSALPPITAGNDIQDSYSGGGLSGWFSISRGFTSIVKTNEVSFASVEAAVTGGGDPTTLLGSVVKLFKGIVAVTTLGFVFAVAFLVAGGIFWCCRCCGKCGGERRQDDLDHMGLLTIVSVIVLLLFTSIVLAGAVLSFFSNQLFYDSYTEFPTTAKNSLEVAKQYGTQTGSQLDTLFCQLNDTSTIGQQAIDSLVTNLNNVIDRAVSPILPRVVTIGQSITTVNNALVAMNTSAAILKSMSQTLSMTIGMLNNNVTSLRVQLVCNDTNVITAPLCSMVPPANFTTVADFTNFPDISGTVNNVASALQNVTLQQAIVNVITSIQSAINGNASAIQSSIRNLTNDVLKLQNIVNSTLNQFINGPNSSKTCSGIQSINDVESCVAYISGFISPYNKAVYGVGLAICSLALVTVVLVVVGVATGVAGYERFIRPHERSSLSNCGGIFLLVAVFFTFLFGFFLLILATIAFLLSSFMLVACDSLAGPQYPLLAQLQPLLNGLKVDINITDVLNQCQNNDGIYKVLNLDRKLNLSQQLDVKSKIPNLYNTFNSAANSINFANQSVLLGSATNALKSFSNANITFINFTAFEQQVNASIVSFNSTSLIFQLELLRSNVTNSSIITTINGTIDVLKYLSGNLLPLMQQQVGILDTSVKTAQNLAGAAVYNASLLLNDTARALDNFTVYSAADIIQELNSTYNTVVGYVVQFQNYAISSLFNYVAGCRPVFKVYGGIYTNLCQKFLGGLIEFWWSLGFCALFFPAVIISAVITSRFFIRMKYDDPNDIEYMMKPTQKR